MSLESPYKGLVPFGDSDVDALLFFGREREREIVVANLIAARLTVLFGPTGVGKSSLLRAGVARALRELPESPLVVVFDRWSDNPSSELASAIAEAAGIGVGDRLFDVVERVQQERDVYVVLDQAEEYFVYQDETSEFDAELARLVGEPLRVNVLLSLREDSLARLDRFKPRIPFVYSNSLRLDRLDREAGRVAIVGPVERWNELQGEEMEAEHALVEAVLDGVRTDGVPQVGGRGGTEGNGRLTAIEAPYLQLVMQRVWEVERVEGSATLRAATLDDLGGARKVVADHLQRAIEELTPSERDVAARLFTYLVTPSGTKIAHELPDLAEYAGVAEDEARPVVATLSRHRILRPDEAGRTEIFHDVLASEVLGWRRAHEAVRALERERAESRRRHRRLAWLAGLACLALLLTALLAIFAFSQRSDARDEAKKSKAHELEASATGALDRDPELSLLLALEAVGRAPDATAERVLRDALLASRVRVVASIGKPLLGAAFRGRDLLVATSDGHVVVADRATGERKRAYSTGVGAEHASFSRNGTVLLTGRDHKLRVVGAAGAVTEVAGITDARDAVLSSDGSLAAVIDPSGVRVVDLRSGRARRVALAPGIEAAAISNDGKRLLTGSFDARLRLRDVVSGELIQTFPRHEKHAVAVAFSPDGRRVASASSDNLARIWQTVSGNLIGISSSHTNSLTDVSFSLDGDQVVTASQDGTARIAKADGGTVLVTLVGHSEVVTSAVFSGGANSSVLTASTDGTARVWDATVQPQLREIAQLHGPVRWVSFGARGRIHAVLADGRAVVVDPRTGRVVDAGRAPTVRRRAVAADGATARIRGKTVILRSDGHTFILRKHRDRVLSVAFSPDGSVLATASKDHDVRLWDVSTGEPLLRLQHGFEVRDAQFSPDGRWIVTASGRAGLYDARDGRLILRLQGHEGPVASAAFDPGGHTIATGGDDGTVREYRCEICGGMDELVSLARARLAITGRELSARERAKYLG